jgi:hypothetical protein
MFVFSNTFSFKLSRIGAKLTFILACIIILSGCTKKTEKLFELRSSQTTGVKFINEILEDEYFNIISYEYLYNGAGVGVGDFNNDGLQDLFFCGNMVSNRLFLNTGDLKFEDITRAAGIEASGIWSTGVAIVDINHDGWQDIYVCASYSSVPELRKNLMFINNGLNEDGQPTFTEKATEMLIDDDGYSTNAAFFDYDKDGDLDLYVLTNMLDTDFPNKYKSRKVDGSSITNDRFYRNNGNGTFENYTDKAGIKYEGYGLGISIVDIDQDGWKDIYITNDYLTSDLLYINNQDGTFTDRISYFTKHIGHSAMGHDIADINNDGLPDIYTLDMLPDDNQRLKQMYAGSRFSNTSDNRKYGYHDQYKRNVLQLNNGPDAFGNHLFSEIGLFANVYATDWSWSALLADFDNDGFRDLFISNGYPRDVTDLDYATSGSRRGMRLSMEEELENIPVRHIPNYLFRNTGEYSFTDMSAEWGFDLPSYSNGAAYVDLDNDGDLDIVTNNINEPASIYENRLYANGKTMFDHHYMKIKLKSELHSGIGLGYIVSAYVDGQSIYSDHSIYHGFLSTVDPVIHIGLGSYVEVDSLLISKPDGKILTMYNIPADQVIEINDDQFNDIPGNAHDPSGSDPSVLVFNPVLKSMGIDHFHKEDPFNDFNFQPTLPFQLSQYGPAISVADLDGNGEFDFYIGGSKKYPGSFYFQQNGRFRSEPLIDEGAVWSEDQGSLLFDIEGDGDIDLLVISGSVEQEINAPSYKDRVYLNNGDGAFTTSPNILPGHVNPGTCIKGADIDLDGDIDLFIGGGSLPGQYPFSAPSYILRNDSEQDKPLFTDITSSYCPMLQDAGVVKDALWTDFNNDTNIDLILAVEWMPIIVLENQGDQLIDITKETGIEKQSGWWNSLAGGDFDNDGDIDYLTGNHGLNSYYKANTHESITAYASDFDNNGRTDLVLAGFAKDIDGSRMAFPVHFRNDLNKQMDLMRKRFPSFKSYSEATIDSMFSADELKPAKKLMVNYLESSYIENLGNGKFKMFPLPLKTQFAPVFGMLTGDFNRDQYLDVLVVGNFFGNNPFWGKMDAMNGLLLAGRGNGQFDILEYTESGFLVPGDAKAIVDMPLSDGEQLILVSQNQDSLKAFTSRYSGNYKELNTNDTYADILFEDGSIRRQEFYYGNTFLSQAPHIFRLPENVKSFKIFNTKK